MINTIVSTFLRRRIAVLMVIAGINLFGYLALIKIPFSLFPRIELPNLTIITNYQSASPSEIESLITKPISDLLGTIQGLEQISSESRDGYSFVFLKFKNNFPIDYAVSEVREKLELIRDSLPQDSEKPLITKLDPNSKSCMQIVFIAKDGLPEKSLKEFLKNQVMQYIERVEGVANVQLEGGFDKEIQISLDPLKTNSYKINPSEIPNLININNKNYPAGQLPFGNKELLVRTFGELEDLTQIENLILHFEDKSGPIVLKDIAKVSLNYKERSGLSKYNSSEAVIIRIFKESGKNVVQLNQEIKDTLKLLEKQFSKEIGIRVVFDESIFVIDSLTNLLWNLIIGSFLAFFCLLIILKNFYSPFLLLSAIPITLLSSFLFFDFLKIDFNLMSLGGLTLGIGMLFDSSNVVLSAIERNLESGLNLNTSIIKGVNEVFGSLFSATSTTIIVFLPIGFMKTILGIVFADMAFAIVICISMSFLISLTYLPVAISLIYQFRKSGGNFFGIFLIYPEAKIKKIYILLLKKLLSRRIEVLSFIALIFLTSCLFSFLIKKEFLPKLNTGSIILRLDWPSGTTLDTMNEFTYFFEEKIRKIPDVKTILTFVGGDERNLKSNPKAIISANQAEIQVILKESSYLSNSQLISMIKSQIKLDKGQILTFYSGEDTLGEILSEQNENFEFLIAGTDLNLLRATGNRIKDKIKFDKNITSIHTLLDDDKNEFMIKYDYEKMIGYGFNSYSVSLFLRMILNGTLSSRVFWEGQETELLVKFENKVAPWEETLKNKIIKASNGENIYLSQFVNIEIVKAAPKILKQSNLIINPISIAINESSNFNYERIKNYIREFEFPKDVFILESRSESKIQESFNELQKSFLLALILIFMILSGQLESFKASLSILACVPLIFIGIFPSLYLSEKTLNISSFMGIILLLGVVVDNGSLFYEYFTLPEQECKPNFERILFAAETVFRPILLNNLTTILGMLPIVLSIGRGSEFQAPLGVTVISGLISSTFLSLIIIPIIFSMVFTNGKYKH